MFRAEAHACLTRLQCAKALVKAPGGTMRQHAAAGAPLSAVCENPACGVQRQREEGGAAGT